MALYREGFVAYIKVEREHRQGEYHESKQLHGSAIHEAIGLKQRVLTELYDIGGARVEFDSEQNHDTPRQCQKSIHAKQE